MTQTGIRTLEGNTLSPIDIDSIREALKMFEIYSYKNLTKDQLNKAYRKKAIKLHPNKGGTKGKFQELVGDIIHYKKNNNST